MQLLILLLLMGGQTNRALHVNLYLKFRKQARGHETFALRLIGLVSVQGLPTSARDSVLTERSDRQEVQILDFKNCETHPPVPRLRLGRLLLEREECSLVGNVAFVYPSEQQHIVN